MNIVLEKLEEYENGELKGKYSEAFIRGNNGKIKWNLFDNFNIFQFFISVPYRWKKPLNEPRDLDKDLKKQLIIF